MPLVYLSDIRLNASLAGPPDGPVLVFAHALGTDHTIWNGTRAALTGRYRVLTYDQRGHGASDTPAPPHSMGALIRGAGHLPMVEQPVEYAALLESFLHDIGHT